MLELYGVFREQDVRPGGPMAGRGPVMRAGGGSDLHESVRNELHIFSKNTRSTLEM